MISVLSQPFGSMRALQQGQAPLRLAFSGVAYGQGPSDYAVDDDVAIYYAVLPAEMLRTYPPGSDEARMHGGVPREKHVHHVQIALFGAETGARITNASLVATINEVGLGGTELALESFQVGDVQTYGNYFEFQKRDLYEIKVRAVLPADGRVITKTFEYRHQ